MKYGRRGFFGRVAAAAVIAPVAGELAKSATSPLKAATVDDVALSVDWASGAVTIAPKKQGVEGELPLVKTGNGWSQWCCADGCWRLICRGGA